MATTRLRRGLGAAAAASSTLLFLAVLALLIRSAWTNDLLTWGGPSRALVVNARTAGLRLVLANRDGEAAAGWRARDGDWDARTDLPHRLLLEARGFQYEQAPPRPLSLQWEPGRPRWQKLGFSHSAAVSPAGRVLASEWTVPYYPMLFALGGPLLWRLAAWRRRLLRSRRFHRGLCPTCGYDLLGTALAGRESCPECGESIPQR